MENPRSGHLKCAWLISTQHDLFSLLGLRQAVALTGLLAPAALCLRVGRRRQPSHSVNICRFAELRRYPTSANIESKLAVKALMWTANSGTPKSS
jgi:hypothetical protein